MNPCPRPAWPCEGEWFCLLVTLGHRELGWALNLNSERPASSFALLNPDGPPGALSGARCSWPLSLFVLEDFYLLSASVPSPLYQAKALNFFLPDVRI